jgi:hypothetical protein|tara:strand:- start:1406 stop:1936 length:531 start_codon:yes stop_codon:yes gene_type:complete
MAETPIVSESLQKDFRTNFPSQISSGRDLHVSDVIVPIVDFSTSTAVTGLGTSLQQALDFNVTTFDVTNANTTVLNTTGFYRIFGNCGTQGNTTSDQKNRIYLDDGSTEKTLIDFYNRITSGAEDLLAQFDFIVFLKTGVSLKVQTGSERANINGCARQVADISGTLQNPDGYTGS